MNKRNINEGDIVTACWNNNEQVHDLTVVSTPANTGDLWYVETKKGNSMAINPNCSEFSHFIKHKTVEVDPNA